MRVYVCEEKVYVCSFQDFWDWTISRRLWKIENQVFRGDGGIGAASRLAAAHRAADTTEPYKRDDILQMRPIILRGVLIEATP